MREIDDAAEKRRQQFITPGAGQALVYRAKMDEATRFLADGTIGPFMWAEIGLTAPSAQDLADLWIGMNDVWQGEAARIEAKRLAAKSAVQAATSPDEIEAARHIDWSS